MTQTGLYSRTYTEHAEAYAPAALRDSLVEANRELREAIVTALESGNPSGHIIRIHALQARRCDLYDQAYADSPELRSHGRAVEYFSPKILTEFLPIAAIPRLNAKEAIEKGSVERKCTPGYEQDPPTIRILDASGKLAILIDGCGRIWENEYDADGNLVTTRFYADDTKMNEKGYSDEGTYTGSLEWIEQHRVVGGFSESRAFTGLGTLSYDWKRDKPLRGCGGH